MVETLEHKIATLSEALSTKSAQVAEGKEDIEKASKDFAEKFAKSEQQCRDAISRQKAALDLVVGAALEGELDKTDALRSAINELASNYEDQSTLIREKEAREKIAASAPPSSRRSSSHFRTVNEGGKRRREASSRAAAKYVVVGIAGANIDELPGGEKEEKGARRRRMVGSDSTSASAVTASLRHRRTGFPGFLFFGHGILAPVPLPLRWCNHLDSEYWHTP